MIQSLHADACMLQDTRIWPSAVPHKQQWAATEGLSMACVQAVPTEADNSGGVAVAVRSAFGMACLPGWASPQLEIGRVAITWADVAIADGLLLGSVYLLDSVGLDPRNVASIMRLGEVLHGLGRRFLIGGTGRRRPRCWGVWAFASYWMHRSSRPVEARAKWPLGGLSWITFSDLQWFIGQGGERPDAVGPDDDPAQASADCAGECWAATVDSGA